ncbi:MAG: V-type ATPase subunit [Oscillospiraceae bacterium]|jgi:V/A-type H+-transporting ATPase subunit C|nr:V-type ATPase subunit [Oscillospiraceae bacterium]
MALPDTEYAYAVARVRANEHSLLSAAELDALIAAPSYDAAVQQLRGKGWALHTTPVTAADDIFALWEEMDVAVWRLLEESAPDIKLFYPLIAANDFFNLKAALKAVFSGLEPESYCRTPSVTPLELIAEAAAQKRFELLPTHLREAAEAAYDALARVGSGQLAEIIIDRAALNNTLQLAREGQIPQLVQWAEQLAAAANIKIALRCAQTGKSLDFTLRAMGQGSWLDNKQLTAAALEGHKALADYLRTTPCAAAAEALSLAQGSRAALERWSDSISPLLLAQAQSTAFGPAPLIAYYLRGRAELKTVRIILLAKRVGVSEAALRTRCVQRAGGQ